MAGKLNILKVPTPLCSSVTFEMPLKWPMWDRYMTIESLSYLNPEIGGIL
jgi:hypothetical protein